MTCRCPRSALIAALAFAAGVAVGVLSVRGAASGSGAASADEAESDTVTIGGDVRPDGAEATVVFCGTEPSGTASPSVAVVESTPSAPLTAAHLARRERRAAARAEKAAERRDFLAAVSPELLTGEQLKLHAEYSEALAASESAMEEIRDLRSRGEEVPADLQRRFAEAQSVARADAEEERRALREAAARAAGLDAEGVRALLEDLDAVDAAVRSDSSVR